MRHFFRRHLPDHETLRQHRWIRPLAGWLHHPNLWHLNRRSVSGGVAVGLFSGLVPGPLQMLSAAILAVTLRVNLPVAVFTTLYTNPFTIVPLYLLAYGIGAALIGNGSPVAVQVPDFSAVHWHDWLPVLTDWLVGLGPPLLLGLLLLALGLALCGFITVRLLWRLSVIWRWKKRIR